MGEIWRRDAAGGAPADSAGESVPPLRLRTHDLPVAEQFEAWRRFSAGCVDVTLDAAPAPGFAAQQDVWQIGGFAFTRADMPGAGYMRTWRHLTRDPLDHWCLVLAEGDGEAGRLLGIRSLAQPFVGQGDDRRVLSLFIPRDMFGGLSAALDGAPPDLAGLGLGGMLADYLVSLDRRLPSVTREEMPALAQATRAVLAACFAPTPGRLAEAAAPLSQTLLEKARAHVRAHLREPGLSPESVGRALGLSRSRLYRLFEHLGGVNRYIQRQRLLAALAALSDPANGEAIVHIAEGLGFLDASGFSRAFKAEFGVSPSDARAAGLSGLALGGAAPSRPPARGADLGAVLRGLQS